MSEQKKENNKGFMIDLLDQKNFLKWLEFPYCFYPAQAFTFIDNTLWGVLEKPNKCNYPSKYWFT